MKITSPTLLLDKEKCLSNIRRMAEKANRQGLMLKPHFKTHQSATVGEWFRDFGISSITVSSASMAEYFAGHGWKDITIAFPPNIREADRINNLAQRVTLGLLINDEQTAQHLDDRLSSQVEVYIEINTGANRTGIKPDSIEKIKSLHNRLLSSEKLNFYGFYSHPGHSYSSRSKKEILAVHEDALSKMQSLKSHFPDQNKPVKCCIGDTPCCSVAEHFDGIDEISPGNFVFYDLMQVQIGSCSIDDIAIALAAPVVEKNQERNEIIVHGGAVHLSKESITWNDEKILGLPVRVTANSWSSPLEESFVKAISQEHGIISIGPKYFDQIKTGDLVGILPVHSCLTANLMGEFEVME